MESQILLILFPEVELFDLFTKMHFASLESFSFTKYSLTKLAPRKGQIRLAIFLKYQVYKWLLKRLTQRYATK